MGAAGRFDRDMDDVLDGFISPENAREDYGVILQGADDGYDWKLDMGATEGLREELRASAK